MTDGPICMTARMRAAPDCADALRLRLLRLVAPTRAEAGCTWFQVCVNERDPREFVVLAEWASKRAYEARMEHDYMREYLAELPSLVEGEWVWDVFVPLGSKS
jgi:quinol monooxygenase YgiN